MRRTNQTAILHRTNQTAMMHRTDQTAMMKFYDWICFDIKLCEQNEMLIRLQ